MAELRVLRTRDELLATVGAADAFGRFDPPEQLSAGYAVGSAVAYLRRAHAGRSTLSVWGADLTGLLDALAAAGILGDLVPGDADRRVFDQAVPATGSMTSLIAL